MVFRIRNASGCGLPLFGIIFVVALGVVFFGLNSLFACWFQPAQTSQPTVFSSHKKPAPASPNQHQHQPANRPEIGWLLKWSSLKPAHIRGGYRVELKILVSSCFFSPIYYEKLFTKCFFKQLQLHRVPPELKPIKATPLMKQSSTKPDLNI